MCGNTGSAQGKEAEPTLTRRSLGIGAGYEELGLRPFLRRK